MLNTHDLPYCPGCGHRIANQNLDKAILQNQLKSLDIIVVSDIGCCGLIDGVVDCHTIHGLHGRSCALAIGVALGLNDGTKQVIAIQGDGGATIGLQHLLEAARRNVNMTLIVLNNLVYGMTGGQISGLSAENFKAERVPEEKDVPFFDLVRLSHTAGAAYSARVVGKGRFEEILTEAIKTKGFSMVEIVGLCTPYGLTKMKELGELGYEEIILKNDRKSFELNPKEKVSLFEKLSKTEPKYKVQLRKPYQIVLAGSAGEGIQSAADILAKTAMLCGLNATKKGEYPITVGTGFSIGEIIFSEHPVLFTGIEHPDLLIITSQDGYNMMKGRYSDIKGLIIDNSIPNELKSQKVISGDYRRLAGGKGAAMCAVADWLKHEKIMPMEAMFDCVSMLKYREEILKAVNAVEVKVS